MSENRTLPKLPEKFTPVILQIKNSKDSSASTVNRHYRMDNPGFKTWQGQIFSSPKHPRKALCPPKPSISKHWEGAAGMHLTTQLHLVLHLQMSGTTPLLPLHIFICAEDQLYFFMFHSVINTHNALCPITSFCTESHADSKDKSTNHGVTYLTLSPGYITQLLMPVSSATGWGSHSICWVGQLPVSC